MSRACETRHGGQTRTLENKIKRLWLPKKSTCWGGLANESGSVSVDNEKVFCAWSSPAATKRSNTHGQERMVNEQTSLRALCPLLVCPTRSSTCASLSLGRRAACAAASFSATSVRCFSFARNASALARSNRSSSCARDSYGVTQPARRTRR